MSGKDGGGAFPYSALGSGGFHTLYRDSKGMTLRDYFAAKAMHALISGYLSSGSAKSMPFSVKTGDHNHAAEAAYKIADAMLQARESGVEND